MRLYAYLLVISTLALPLHAEDTSPYNKGVAAFRAKDFVEARKQWKLSLAEGGPDEALNNLGFLLNQGLGGDPDPKMAVELWRKGAALSVSEAQLQLGRAYAKGQGITQNLTAAYAWYRCALATSGRLSKQSKTEAAIEADTAAVLDELLPKLSTAELKSGDALAAELISRYAKPLVLTQ